MYGRTLHVMLSRTLHLETRRMFRVLLSQTMNVEIVSAVLANVKVGCSNTHRHAAHPDRDTCVAMILRTRRRGKCLGTDSRRL